MAVEHDLWRSVVANRLFCLIRYAFDVATYSGQPFLINRRLFALADTGIPDGIKCDMNGNVYSGCGDGLNVWSPGGILLAKVLVGGGVANFCFGKGGQIFLLNEHRLWRLQLDKGCNGALLGL
jgi:gluconolactonase